MAVRRRFDPVTLVAVLGSVLLVAAAVLGPVLWGGTAEAVSVSERLSPAGPDHLFGTDELGRDIFARVMSASQLSLMLALGATAIAALGGIVFGLTASALPRVPRRLLMGLLDILLAFPGLLMVLFITVIWSASATGAMFAIGIAGIPSHARLVYNLASSLSGRDFIRAARVVGVGPIGILWRHVLPNIANPLLVNAAAAASVSLLSFAGLSFLGLGVQAPEYDWGRMLQEGNLRIYVNPMAAIGPGIAIVLAGVVFTLLSEALAKTQGGGIGAVRAHAVSMVAGRRAKRAASRVRPTTAPPASGAANGPPAVAEVKGLRVSFPAAEGELVDRVRDVDLSIRPGEVIGIVGESGSGKSLTARALADLLEPPSVVTCTTHTFDGLDLGRASRAERARLGVELGMVFQDPLTSLNPALTVGRQLTEVPEVHLKMPRADARDRAADALDAVGIGQSSSRLRQYPHEFSGGMRQRAMVAMSMTGRPKLIIADEPTTALDVTVQRQVMGVLRRAQTETGAAILFISHDIALVSAFCDRVVVMKDAEIVETLDAQRIQQDATHPYTRALIACLPDMRSDRTKPLPVIPADFAARADAEEVRA